MLKEVCCATRLQGLVPRPCVDEHTHRGDGAGPLLCADSDAVLSGCHQHLSAILQRLWDLTWRQLAEVLQDRSLGELQCLVNRLDPVVRLHFINA